MSIKSINTKTVLIVVLICVLGGVFWAILPLFGWSYYSLEGSLTSCSVEWYERSFNVISYNVTIFVFMFFIPLLLIFGSNLKLVLIVYKCFMKFILIFKLRYKFYVFLFVSRSKACQIWPKRQMTQKLKSEWKWKEIWP